MYKLDGKNDKSFKLKLWRNVIFVYKYILRNLILWKFKWIREIEDDYLCKKLILKKKDLL